MYATRTYFWYKFIFDKFNLFVCTNQQFYLAIFKEPAMQFCSGDKPRPREAALNGGNFYSLFLKWCILVRLGNKGSWLLRIP